MNASPLETARLEPQRSTFSPPSTLVRSVPPQAIRKAPVAGLAASAVPWTPQAKTALPTTGPKPPAPLHSSPPLQPAVPPPAALGNSPSLEPSVLRQAKDIPPMPSSPSWTSPLSVTTPQSATKAIMTEEALETGVYSLDMFLSLRSDCAHTPIRVLNWVAQLYRSHPTLKVPAHLILTVDEPIVEDASGLLSRPTVIRRRPVRQVQHKVMSVLSRVTPQKYPELQKELLELPLKQTTDAELKEVVRVFFEKAVQEEKFCPLYASLVADICKMTEAERDLEKEQKDKLLSTRMRHELLSTCQEEFQRPIQLTEDDKVDPLTGKLLDAAEVDGKRDRLKRRLCGNIKFVGELYKKKLVTERVVGLIMDLLVGDFDTAHPTRKEDYVFEVFQTLLKCVGVVCKDSNPELLRRNMDVARKILCHPTPRIRFLMMDLEDMERRGWAPRDRLMTMEERERETIEVQRRGYEEIERRAKVRQQELDDYVISNAVNPNHNLATPTTPFGHGGPRGPTIVRPSALPLRNAPNSLSANDLKHPHGTPTASPAKSKVFGQPSMPTASSSNSIPSSPNLLMTPPPKYQRNPTISADRSPVVHPSANLNVPHALSSSMLNESVYSTSGSRMDRVSSTNSIGSGYVATPLSPSAPPLPLNDITNNLMSQLATKKDTEEVIHALRTISTPQRVSVLTLWLRRACATTKLFTEREQLCGLFAAFLQCATHPAKAVISPQDLAVTVLEWARYDMERGQFGNCPRLFANMATMVLHAYQPEGFPPHTDPTIIALVRGIFNGMMFSVLLRELHAHDSLQAIPTLVRDAHPITQQILSLMPDKSLGPKGDVMLAMQNRFRILKFVLYGDGALTRAQTPPTPSPRSSPLNESFGSYDVFSQCLKFPKVTDDIEFTLYRRLREAPDANAWREQAIQMAMSPLALGNKEYASPVVKLVHVMKVVGTLLTVLHPKDALQPLTNNIRSEDLDHVVHSIINKRRNAVEVQCAAVIELITHFTYTVANITTPAIAESPSRTASHTNLMNGSLTDAGSSWTTVDTRMNKMSAIFRRWRSSGIIQSEAVLEVLGSIKEGSPGPHADGDAIAKAASLHVQDALCTLQHNFVVEASLSSALHMLSSA